MRRSIPFTLLLVAACATPAALPRDASKTSPPAPIASAHAAASSPSLLVPPPTRRDDVHDVLHGVDIVDPYRWLEDQDSPETRAWIDAQNKYTHALLDDVPGRREVAEQVASLQRYERRSTPFSAGHRYPRGAVRAATGGHPFRGRLHELDYERVASWSPFGAALQEPQILSVVVSSNRDYGLHLVNKGFDSYYPPESTAYDQPQPASKQNVMFNNYAAPQIWVAAIVIDTDRARREGSLVSRVLAAVSGRDRAQPLGAVGGESPNAAGPG